MSEEEVEVGEEGLFTALRGNILGSMIFRALPYRRRVQDAVLHAFNVQSFEPTRSLCSSWQHHGKRWC
jgi:hypothetical protein